MSHVGKWVRESQHYPPATIESEDPASPLKARTAPLGDALYPPSQITEAPPEAAVTVNITGDKVLELAEAIDNTPAVHLGSHEVTILNHLRSNPGQSFRLKHLVEVFLSDTAAPDVSAARINVALCRLELAGRMLGTPLVSTTEDDRPTYQTNPQIRYVDCRSDSQPLHLPLPRQETKKEAAVATIPTVRAETPAPETPPTLNVNVLGATATSRETAKSPAKNIVVAKPPRKRIVKSKPRPEVLEATEELAGSGEERTLLRRHNAIIRTILPHVEHPAVTGQAIEILDSFGIDYRARGTVANTDFAEFNQTVFEKFHAALEQLDGVEGLVTRPVAQPEQQPGPAVVALAAAYKAAFEGNLPFALYIRNKFFARKYGGLEDSDIVQAANSGLANAITRFDLTRDNTFGTYAEWHIKKAVQYEISTCSRAIRIPRRVHEQYMKMRRVELALQHAIGRAPKIHELASELGMKESELRFLQDQTYELPTLDKQLPKSQHGHGGETESIGSQLVDETAEAAVTDIVHQEEVEEQLGKVFKDPSLTRLHKAVLGLCCNIAPAVVGNSVYLLVDGRRQTYAELYQQLANRKDLDSENFEAEIADFLGISCPKRTDQRPSPTEVVRLRDEAIERITAAYRQQ